MSIVDQIRGITVPNSKVLDFDVAYVTFTGHTAMAYVSVTCSRILTSSGKRIFYEKLAQPIKIPCSVVNASVYMLVAKFRYQILDFLNFDHRVLVVEHDTVLSCVNGRVTCIKCNEGEL